MEIDGQVFLYPPIYEDINEWGETAYRVVLNDRTETIQFMDPMSFEEAQLRVQGVLRHGLRMGNYQARDFYPQDANDTYMQLPQYAVEGHGLDDGQHCFDVAPASSEAVVGLPEASAKDGECSVCLENFEAGNNKLRMMPCSHSFHEHCIFNWLRINHVCPLCRFPLPTNRG